MGLLIFLNMMRSASKVSVLFFLLSFFELSHSESLSLHSTGNQKPAYPSSKPKTVDWDKLEAQVKKEVYASNLGNCLLMSKDRGNYKFSCGSDLMMFCVLGKRRKIGWGRSFEQIFPGYIQRC